MVILGVFGGVFNFFLIFFFGGRVGGACLNPYQNSGKFYIKKKAFP